LKLVKPLQDLYAASEDAEALGISAAQLGARCSTCRGTGTLTLDMAFLPPVHQPCETCGGSGCVAEAWQVRLHGIPYPQIFELTIDQVYDLFEAEERLKRPLQAAREVGLGYLVLRQPGYALSGGEAQRLKIASELSRSRPGKTQAGNTLYLLDEPSLGQHLEDVARLAGVLRRLVNEGGSVILVEHHAHLLACCDWLVELGPTGGPQGGYLVAEGTPEELAAGDSPTAPYLRGIL
jgi:excinuclease ABC subunit A